MATITRFSGAGMTKKLLWTNPSPNSAFTGQNITIPEVYSNFDFLMIEFKFYRGFEAIHQTLWSKETIGNSNGASDPHLVIGAFRTGAGLCCRRVYLGNPTLIVFSSSQQINGTGIDNNVVIPIKIYGVKGKIAGGG